MIGGHLNKGTIYKGEEGNLTPRGYLVFPAQELMSPEGQPMNFVEARRIQPDMKR